MRKGTNKEVITVSNVSKSYNGNLVLNNVSFSLHEKEILGIIGPSGSGKTTLLKCLDFLTYINSGEIFIDDFRLKVNKKSEIEITRRNDDILLPENALVDLRKEVGFVFQSFNLWEERTVMQNITLAPLIVSRKRKEDVYNKASEYCFQYGLGDKLESKIYELSGGQKQRVAIVRALMMNPKYMFLDEVTSALDPVLTAEVLNAIKKLKEEGLSIIIVTHHIQFASELCDRIMFLENGEIAQIDTPEVLKNKPKTPSIKSFLKTLESVG